MPRGPLLHQRPAKALDIWLAIYYAFVIGYKWRTWSVRPVPPAFYVAALLLLSLPYLTSIIDIYVLRALHRVRAQLPVRHLQQIHLHHKSQIAVLRPRGRPLRFCGPGRGLGCVGPGRVQEENARGVVWVFLGALNRCFGPTEISRIRIRIRVALLIAQQRFWALATVQS